ncbi:MAG: 16S rRNA (uracil(1498)-N(3))-methyltransferase [Gammaproteobacteria bacterium]|nr:16S rRNA (uracil(1498)-N(3))-methyltransferase [Gammaproteobacteria bacterium]
MRLSRIYIEQTLSSDATISVQGDEYNYIKNVLRLGVGAELVLFNGEGGDYAAQIESVSKRSVEIKIGEFSRTENESGLYIHLVQAITKGDRMDFSIQKAVELGVKEITPVFTRYSAVSLDDKRREKKHEHWRRVVISASEQCGRSVITKVHPPVTLEQWLQSSCSNAVTHIVMVPQGQNRFGLLEAIASPCVLLIGPEGGFSDEEVEKFTSLGFSAVSLGPRILRAETATITAISILQSRWGDLG